jgi:hypothetical protein
MPGLVVQQSDINITSGDICRSLTHALNRGIEFKRFLDRFSSAQLVSNFGFTQVDADLIKSAFTDLATVNTTFQANRAFISQLTGLGDV